MMTKPTPLQTRNGGFNFPPPEQEYVEEYVEEQDPEGAGAAIGGMFLVVLILIAGVAVWELW